MLSIKNLHARIGDKEILRGIDLEIADGEVHAIMGPNGSGKSTLSYVLSGRDGYEVTAGDVTFNGENLLDMGIAERAAAGVFLAFQYPVEIPGISTMSFLRTALNSLRRARGEKEMEAIDFLKFARAKAAALEIDDKMLQRPVNVGFSGGEKKRNEVLQMSLLEPKLMLLDETDSGLDIDALKIVSKGVNALRDPERSFLVITHYQRLLSHIVPDRVSVLAEGRIVATGGKELALELEEHGYAAVGLKDEAAA
jgi:Fe-S cluster assembly ATP-binding protein